MVVPPHRQACWPADKQRWGGSPPLPPHPLHGVRATVATALTTRVLCLNEPWKSQSPSQTLHLPAIVLVQPEAPLKTSAPTPLAVVWDRPELALSAQTAPGAKGHELVAAKARESLATRHGRET